MTVTVARFVVIGALVVLATLAGCGAGYHRVLTLDEIPAGTCPRAKLDADESCTTGAREYAAGAVLGTPRGEASGLGGTAWFRWPLVDVELDERTLRHGSLAYHSLAGGVGTHLRPLMFWPGLERYADLVVDLGFDLGGLKKDSHFEGRGDGYVVTAIDLFAPDVGPLRYLDTGVPGLRFDVRYTAFVQGWDSETTFEVGLIWRWGVPIDLYRHWTTQRTGD